MRTRKFFAIAAAGLVALATVFAGPAPANATTYPITTWISVLGPNGSIGPKVLDIKDKSTANGARAQLWQLNRTDNQLWTIERIGTYGNYYYYELKNKLSQKCLDMATDGPVGNGTRVQQWDCRHTANQRWIARPVQSGNNWVELVNIESGRCLDVTDVNYADGALLQVWSCSGDWNQRWNIS
ncbi:RICIN domain-containing protein [Planotetraspora sp. GP83]|uniref:RICIN domain-containing protein n=1 Tax=Planotetraspora sp. GP83 TaxID=3156264 RepID=UPI0035165A56